MLKGCLIYVFLILNVRCKSQHKNTHAIELHPETAARACSSVLLMNCCKNTGWAEGEQHFISLCFSLQGRKGKKRKKKSPEKELGIRKSNTSNKTSKHKRALLYTFEWKEGVERNRGLVKKKLLSYSSDSWKCLFFNSVSVVI